MKIQLSLKSFFRYIYIYICINNSIMFNNSLLFNNFIDSIRFVFSVKLLILNQKCILHINLFISTSNFVKTQKNNSIKHPTKQMPMGTFDQKTGFES